MPLYITSGKYRGRRIESPEGKEIRPTVSRVREAVFNILTHGSFGSNRPVYGRIADIFCGSGVMGLEALSRGAEHVTFIDKNPQALEVLEYNIIKLGEENNTKLLRADSSDLPATAEPYDLLLLDPPYNSGLAVDSLITAYNGNWLHKDTVAVLEQSWKETVTIPEQYKVIDERKYGNTRITLLRLA